MCSLLVMLKLPRVGQAFALPGLIAQGSSLRGWIAAESEGCPESSHPSPHGAVVPSFLHHSQMVPVYPRKTPSWALTAAVAFQLWLSLLSRAMRIPLHRVGGLHPGPGPGERRQSLCLR